ncbi:FkbM family methyltransferase, partial [Asaia sp. W19]
MRSPPPMTSRKTAFILANADHGTMIVNRLDFNRNESASLSYGVGYSLLEEGCYDPNDVRCLKSILSVLRQLRGDGIMALDVGANIGVHTLEWARHMTGWGSVLAV